MVDDWSCRRTAMYVRLRQTSLPVVCALARRPVIDWPENQWRSLVENNEIHNKVKAKIY